MAVKRKPKPKPRKRERRKAIGLEQLRARIPEIKRLIAAKSRFENIVQPDRTLSMMTREDWKTDVQALLEQFRSGSKDRALDSRFLRIPGLAFHREL